MKTLVSTDWLAHNIDDPELVVLDGSWYMPADNRDCFAEYQSKHIPNAQFFDIDAISDQTSELPHMVPSANEFEVAVRTMGVSNDCIVVVYDTAGLFSAARVWWLFRAMGHTKVAVLDGGLPKWISEDHPVSDRPTTMPAGTFRADVKNLSTSANDVSNTTAQIVDARAAARFRGEAKEPRAGLRSGRIPGSFNVFFKDLLTETGQLKSDDDLRATFEKAGVDAQQPIITTCGSGVTAAVLDLALSKLGSTKKRLYDGSWSEWGARTDLPIETG